MSSQRTAKAPIQNQSAVCATCGSPAQARDRIEALEHEVQVLTEQSVDALNRLSSYEEEIRQLRMQRSAVGRSTSNNALLQPPPSPSASTSFSDSGAGAHSTNNSVDSAAATAQASTGYGLNRFASFRMNRKPSNSSVDPGDLQVQLAKETAARQEAEQRAAQLTGEIEDLSANLFEQANEMVATERKARSKLEERVATLEKRDKDKTKRLEKIENALKRLERVRTLLAPPSPPP